MSIDRGIGSNQVDLATLVPPLHQVTTLSGEGLLFHLRHAFRSEIKAVPGYVFDVTSADGTLIGTATVLITHDFTDIARIGHIGTEVEPQFRKQGYAVRMGRVLLPFLRDHGVRQALLTCDVGHESQAQSCREVGGIDLDVLPALTPDQRAKARFVVTL